MKSAQMQMDMAPPAGAELVWLERKPGDYFVGTACKRYSVCFLTVGEVVQYVAWRRPCTEIASVVLPKSASHAQMLEAAAAMKQRCAEHAQKGAA